MPSTVIEFEEGTAFERYILDRATPLMPRSRGTSVIELGDGGSTSVAAGALPAMVYVGLTDSAGSAESERSLSGEDIRPLLFGAAWKVLDQAVEYALDVAGVLHDRRLDYSLRLKVTKSTNGTVNPLPPFDLHTDLWSPIMLTYASTETLRNSLVHRRLVIDQSTGEINGVSRPGEASSAALTADEQSAFCRMAAGVAEAVINQRLRDRQANQLRWALDQLHSHHRGAVFGATPAQGVTPVVIVRPIVQQSGDISLDINDTVRRARAAVGGVSYYDLQIHLPDGRILAYPLEEAPQMEATINLGNPPAWLRWA